MSLSFGESGRSELPVFRKRKTSGSSAQRSEILGKVYFRQNEQAEERNKVERYLPSPAKTLTPCKKYSMVFLFCLRLRIYLKYPTIKAAPARRDAF
jgi:hypothetical protein